MPMYLNDKAVKEMGIELSSDINYKWEAESSAIFLFVKDKKEVHLMLQKATVNKDVFDSAKSIKSYSFLQLLNNYGNGSYYVTIPKEKAVFETYAMIYHDSNGEEIFNHKYGLGVKVKK
ncbi:hypothetical protein [Flavobacterium sp. TAB 87]|uniref:hypothetical protein n=1 Tax=Flavobacterium sp. TAB 87 TaxID=1729581 RepID=UPI0012F9B105|nr:hypothetical protein [Flavobacterium sp. TAB 87]